jgi:hypothetical protein
MAYRIYVIALLAALSVAAPADARGLPWGKPFVTGIVKDEVGAVPVSGAYVLAVYEESGGSFFGHGGVWCVRTLGVTTGPDGKFSFPGHNLGSPSLYVIKEGYQSSRRIQDKRVYGKWYEPKGQRFQELWLGKIEASKKTYSLWITCERAKYYEDAVANLRYLELVTLEDEQFYDGSRGDDYLRATKRLEALPRSPSRESRQGH